MRSRKRVLTHIKVSFSFRKSALPLLMGKSIFLFILFLSLFSTTSCNRKEFKVYKGIYNCNRAVTTWTAGEPTEHYVTSDHLIQVEKKRKNIIVQNNAVHIDSIAPNTDYTFSNGVIVYTVHFFNDGILYQEVDSADGTGTRIQYVGNKKQKN